MAAAAARRPCGERANAAILLISDISGPPGSGVCDSIAAFPREAGLTPHNLDTTVSGFATLGSPMDALTTHEAAETTGWSPRMLRYVERVGLVEPDRSASGYRLYGPAELQRLRTLRELLAGHDISLS